MVHQSLVSAIMERFIITSIITMKGHLKYHSLQLTNGEVYV